MNTPFASLALWQRRRRIKKLELGLGIGRRKFIQGLLLAPFTPIPKDTEVLKARLEYEYLLTPEGRLKLAQSMIFPIRRRLDYASIARKVFQVDQLPGGTPQVYYMEPESKSDSES